MSGLENFSHNVPTYKRHILISEIEGKDMLNEKYTVVQGTFIPLGNIFFYPDPIFFLKENKDIKCSHEIST